MGRKKLFSVSTQRNWSSLFCVINRKHEFDSRFDEVLTSRCNCDEYDDVISNEKKTNVSNTTFIKKLSEIMRLPQSVVNSVILDFTDLIALTLSKNKHVTLHSFGRFSYSKENKSVQFTPSKAFIELIESATKLCEEQDDSLENKE